MQLLRVLARKTKLSSLKCVVKDRLSKMWSTWKVNDHSKDESEGVFYQVG